MKNIIKKVSSIIMKSTVSKAITVIVAIAILGVTVFTVNYFTLKEKEKQELALDRELELTLLEIVFDEEKLNVDEESEFDFMSIVESAYGAVTFQEEPLDTTVIGSVELLYVVTSEKYEDINKLIHVTVTVVEIDKTPVIYGAEDITINVNQSVDLLANVSAFDYKGVGIKVESVGTFNIKKAGTYNLKYVATDSYGHTVEVEFKLIVKSTGSGGSNGGSNGGNNNNGNNNNNGGNNNGGDNNNSGTTQACPNGVYPDRPCSDILDTDLGDMQFYGANGYQACKDYGNSVVASGTQPTGATNFMCSQLTNNEGKPAGGALKWFFH